MCQFFTVDDLAYLKRGGRISGAVALIGSMLNIKPILKGDETGHIVMCDKVRGSKKALNALADIYAKLAFDKDIRIGTRMPTMKTALSICSRFCGKGALAESA